jgi:hypothetical protein
MFEPVFRAGFKNQYFTDVIASAAIPSFLWLSSHCQEIADCRVPSGDYLRGIGFASLQ